LTFRYAKRGYKTVTKKSMVMWRFMHSEPILPHELTTSYEKWVAGFMKRATRNLKHFTTFCDCKLFYPFSN
jgi:hypothetical protein